MYVRARAILKMGGSTHNPRRWKSSNTLKMRKPGMLTHRVKGGRKLERPTMSNKAENCPRDWEKPGESEERSSMPACKQEAPKVEKPLKRLQGPEESQRLQGWTAIRATICPDNKQADPKDPTTQADNTRTKKKNQNRRYRKTRYS